MEQASHSIKQDQLISAKSFDRKRQIKQPKPQRPEKIQSSSSEDEEEI
jgi:hypothetical protein